MRILVTGGAGFIASHVVDSYIKAGHSVAVVDNLNTGFRRNVNPKARFYNVDIRDFNAVEKVIKKERPEVINHHAAIAEVVKSLVNPLPTYEVNVLGTANLLVSFAKYGAKKKKFIFSSTGGAIYGEPEKIPADESVSELPLSPYGESKLLGEELIKFYCRIYQMHYLIFRYPNVYGPRQNPKGEAGVVAIFRGLMLASKRPIIFGDGTKARDYVYVSDVADANLRALKKGVNETLNLGWGKPISDQMIFDALAEVMDFTQKVQYAPFRKGEVYRIALKATKAKQVLGWQPTIVLKNGMRLINSWKGR